MPLKLSHFILCMAWAMPAHAENNFVQFSLSYALNKKLFYEKNVNFIEKGCIEAGKMDKTQCAAEAENSAQEMLAYAAYRMATEKSMKDLGELRECWKGANPAKTCEAITAYTIQVYKDYGDVVSFQNDITKLPNKK